MQICNLILQPLVSEKNISRYLTTHTPLELKPEKRLKKVSGKRVVPEIFEIYIKIIDY